MDKNVNTDDALSNLFLRMNLIGESSQFQEVLRLVKKVSRFDVGVFIHGETGTGKELIARAIHYLSSRRDMPFVPVNCGAFTDELFLNEFFGHKKGAYTGADNAYVGLAREADGGTLFLDEVDSLSAKSQVALLRFLQKHEFKSLGCTKIQRVNIRILCACNKDLQGLCRKGAFREDLFYRLDILRVKIPPLRQRDGDIPLLSSYFLEKTISKFNLDFKALHPETLRVLESYSWPGNVRELENYIQKLSLLNDGDLIRIDKVGEMPDISGACNEITDYKFGTFNKEKKRAINYFEKNYLKSVMIKTGGNISRAARYAKKERRSFARLLEKHGIDKNNL